MQTFIEYQKRDLLIGAFIVLSLIVLISVYFLKSEWWGPGTYTVTAEFERISNIKKGTKVRLRGYEIGHVVDVEFEPDPEDGVYFRVKLAIENQYRLRLGTTAKIAGGLIGDKYIDLEAPEEHRVAQLRHDATIPGLTPDDFGEALQGAQEMMRAVTRMVRRIDDADMGGKFGRFVVHIGRITDSVDRMTVSGKEAFDRMSNVFGHMDPGMQRAMVQLEDNLTKAAELLETADTVLVENHAQLRTTLGSLNASLESLKKVAARTDSLTTGSQKDIEETLKNIKAITASLKDLARHPWKFFTGRIDTGKIE